MNTDPTDKNLLKVFIERGEFIDSSRNNRTVLYKFYYPQGGNATKPLIVWSHGLGGTRDGAGYIARYLAAHDYCLLHIQHDGTDSSLWAGKEGHPWDHIRNAKISRATTLERFRDVPFVLDNLNEIEHFELIDTKRIGMSGHSFGALTTQVVAGQLFPNENNDLVSFKDVRLKAGLLYSFVAMGHLYDGNPSDLFGAMDLPLLYMTGTADDNPVDQVDYTFRMPVWEFGGSNEKYLLVLKDGDHMVFNGSRGKLDINPKRELHENIICRISLAYWDMKLKDDKTAADWFISSGVQEYLGKEAEFIKHA